ncbi:Hypothetical protein mma_2245 [Janthinobacterium sp. Marseille]|nr:hypothetical protein [Janthinobacterium sp. Marseille]ABR90914.1 Hypothetical protein mma_2245 [Janthinobacterium sp. Marseille]
MFFARFRKKIAAAPSAEVPKTAASAEALLANSTLYQFKRNVLDLVARMNQGVPHVDCEVIKRQTMFIQTQLLHSLANDPFLPEHLKIMLMEYHAKSIRATLCERRGEHLRRVI